jgi:hypothetical protein
MADPAITTLMHTYLYEIFGQHNPVLRRDAISRTYTEGIAFTDESDTIVGPSAVHDRVQQLLQNAPESFAFSPDGPIYVGADTAALAWRLGPRTLSQSHEVSTSRRSILLVTAPTPATRTSQSQKGILRFMRSSQHSPDWSVVDAIQ